MKVEREFFPTHDMPWQPSTQAGVMERVLSRDEGDPEIMTRLARWEPGTDTSAAGVITHGYLEEVYIVDGALHDLTLDRTFRAGEFAARRPGMRHGPYRTDEGCVMLETRYRAWTEGTKT